jgi:hypothetical protein
VRSPESLFAFLEVPGSEDGLRLCRGLGWLLLAQGATLVAAALWPTSQGALVLFPLSGRALLCGVWLWLLGAQRIALPPEPLLVLLLHDAMWLPVFVVFLFFRRWALPPSKDAKDAVTCLDSTAP